MNETPHAVGRFDRQDWLGRPMIDGSRISWPCDGTNNTKQMAVGHIVNFLDNGGAYVEVERRSRTGLPKPGYDRKFVHLSAVGVANAVVVG